MIIICLPPPDKTLAIYYNLKYRASRAMFNREMAAMITLSKTIFVASMLATSTIALSSSASAALMQAVYTGTVSASYDGTSSFGNGVGVGTLDGLSYSLTFIYDTNLPGALQHSTASLVGTMGGTSQGAPTPILSSSLKINGVSQNIGGSYLGFADLYNLSPSAYAYQYAQEYTVNSVTGATVSNYAYNYLFDLSLGIPVNLTTPFAIGAPSNGYGFGFFQLYSTNDTNQITSYAYGQLNALSAVVKPAPLAATAVSDVPLPGTLPLLAAGLGAIGVVARRRRKQAA